MKINFILIILFCQFQLFAQQKPIEIAFKSPANGFPLMANGKTATIIYDQEDAEVVSIATEALKSDIKQVTGTEITNDKYVIIIGTLGKSKIINQLEKSKEAFENIKILTEKYNKGTANGKWDGMMDDAPRKLKIFQMPETITTTKMQSRTTIIPAANYIHKSKALKSIEGLGIANSGLTVWPMKTYTDTPYADYKILFHKGENKISVRCLPDFPLYPGMKLRYAISIDNSAPAFVDIATVAESKAWSVNILRGYAAGESTYTSDISGEKAVRIYFPDPGVVISDILVNEL